jgi:ADP-ribose pyrophosphatase YjhB (NUDIX family)
MDILSLLDEVQTIARNGLNYATNPYDRERYRRLLQLATVQYEQLLGLPAAEVRQRFADELGHVTPKVGGDAAIFDADGQILLVKRADDGRWCLPCGWVEANESPMEAAVRETKEETGLDVRPLTLVDVITRKANIGYGPHTAVAVIYLCEITGGSLQGSHEGLEVGYWRLEEVPAWHELHEQYATAAFAVWQKWNGGG